MRLEPCGDAAATVSDRIFFLVWLSEMCGSMVPNPVHRVLIGLHHLTTFTEKCSFKHLVENDTTGFSAEHHLFFSYVFSNTNFVRTNDHSFDILSIRLENASVITSCPLRRVPTSTFEPARTSFLSAISTSSAFFVSSRTLALLSQVACYFHMLLTLSSRVGCCGCCCCCCCVSQLLFNVTLGAGLGVASLSYIIRSPFWEVTRSMQSPGSGAKVRTNLSNILHLGCVSKKFGNVLSEEQCDHHEVSLHLGRFQMDSEVWRRLLVELCLSFLTGIIPRSKNGLSVPRNSRVKDALLPVVRNKCVFHHFFSYWNTTRVSLKSS